MRYLWILLFLIGLVVERHAVVQGQGIPAVVPTDNMEDVVMEDAVMEDASSTGNTAANLPPSHQIDGNYLAKVQRCNEKIAELVRYQKKSKLAYLKDEFLRLLNDYYSVKCEKYTSGMQSTSGYIEVYLGISSPTTALSTRMLRKTSEIPLVSIQTILYYRELYKDLKIPIEQGLPMRFPNLVVPSTKSDSLLDGFFEYKDAQEIPKSIGGELDIEDTVGLTLYEYEELTQHMSFPRNVTIFRQVFPTLAYMLMNNYRITNEEELMLTDCFGTTFNNRARNFEAFYFIAPQCLMRIMWHPVKTDEDLNRYWHKHLKKIIGLVKNEIIIDLDIYSQLRPLYSQIIDYYENSNHSLEQVMRVFAYFARTATYRLERLSYMKPADGYFISQGLLAPTEPSSGVTQKQEVYNIAMGELGLGISLERENVESATYKCYFSKTEDFQLARLVKYLWRKGAQEFKTFNLPIYMIQLANGGFHSCYRRTSLIAKKGYSFEDHYVEFLKELEVVGNVGGLKNIEMKTNGTFFRNRIVTHGKYGKARSDTTVDVALSTFSKVMYGRHDFLENLRGMALSESHINEIGRLMDVSEEEIEFWHSLMDKYLTLDDIIESFNQNFNKELNVASRTRNKIHKVLVKKSNLRCGPIREGTIFRPSNILEHSTCEVLLERSFEFDSSDIVFPFKNYGDYLRIHMFFSPFKSHFRLLPPVVKCRATMCYLGYKFNLSPGATISRPANDMYLKYEILTNIINFGTIENFKFVPIFNVKNQKVVLLEGYYDTIEITGLKEVLPSLTTQSLTVLHFMLGKMMPYSGYPDHSLIMLFNSFVNERPLFDSSTNSDNDIRLETERLRMDLAIKGSKSRAYLRRLVSPLVTYLALAGFDAETIESICQGPKRASVCYLQKHTDRSVLMHNKEYEQMVEEIQELASPTLKINYSELITFFMNLKLSTMNGAASINNDGLPDVARFRKVIDVIYELTDFGHTYKFEAVDTTGLTEEEMDKILPHTFKGCNICLDGDDDTVNPGVLVMPKTCGHQYHSSCILPWINKRKDCPVCRKVMWQ